jgi:adenylate cyclase
LILWDDMERRLTAILAADVVGYSRLMGADEAGTLTAVKNTRTDVVDPKIAEHQGRIVKLMGDGILAEFPSVVNAVACAVEIQQRMFARNTEVPQDRRLEFRIGINLGDVIVEGEDIFGDGVNVAARLESIANPGGVTISESVRDHVGNRLDFVFTDLGRQRLKNIEKPIRAYSVSFGNFAVQESKNVSSSQFDQSERPSIVVLPFNNMSGDPEQEYFSDGITEDITTDLSKISGLFVVARHTAFTYKGKPINVEQVGQELGVDYILEGSVRKAGTRIRVTGQLIGAKNGGHLWAERFDRNLTDIFAIQDEITHAIVDQLKVKLLAQEKRCLGQDPPTDNVEAYTYYLRGRQFLHRHSRSYYQLGRRMFAKAVELDPRYARAYAGIADCDSFLFLLYKANLEIKDILATSEKALALNDRLAEAHASRGLALSIEKRYEEANKEFEQAIALDPQSFEAHYFYARASFAQGELERAAALFKRAAEINPDDYQSLILLVQIYRSLRRDGDIKNAALESIKRAERELSVHPEDPRPAYLGAASLVTLGETDRAREWLSRALAIAPDDVVALYNTACVYTRLGDTDLALDLLERSLPHASPEFAGWIKYDSSLDALRNHSRFQTILGSIGKE